MDSSGLSPKWPGCITNAVYAKPTSQKLCTSLRPECRGCSSALQSSASFAPSSAAAPGVHTEVEEALEDRYGLAEAVVVDVEGTNDEVIAALGSAGATYLETTLTGRERIGISSWSQTLLAVVDRMRPFRVPGAESAVQLMGGVGNSSVQTQGNRLLTEFARLVGATATFVPAPALVGNKTMRESLLNDASDGIHRQGVGAPHHGASWHWQPSAVSAIARQRQCGRPR